MTAMLKVCNSYLHVPLPSPISLSGNVLENFRYFREQWKYYSIATGLDKMPEDVKVSILFLTVGRETFFLIQEQLNLSDEEKSLSEKILDALEAHFQPKVNVVWERYTFNQAIQETYETPPQFLDRLKKLAFSCDFKETVDFMIRDRFISGLQDCLLRKELAGDPALTLDKALQKSLQNSIARSPSPEVDDSKKDIVRIEPVTAVDTDQEIVIVKKSRTVKTRSDCRNESDEDFSIGSFIVLKNDYHEMTDPPIWKIDGSALLQKYASFQKEGQTLYKNTAIYSGWNPDNRELYYAIQVVFKHMTRKEHIVRFRRDLLKKAISRS